MRRRIDPRVVDLAKGLGIPISADVRERIVKSALDKAVMLTCDFPLKDVKQFEAFLTNRLSVRIETIEEDADITRIAERNHGFHPLLERILRDEFLNNGTEGITLERDRRKNGFFRFLAVIDGRPTKQSRSYFTKWHEVAHLLLHPQQLTFPGFRRTPTREEIEKDPIESIVDNVAGQLAFYEPFFKPVILAAFEESGQRTFDAIESARQEYASSASFYSTALASIRHIETPVLFVEVGMRLKKTEERVLHSSQQSFDFATRDFSPELRVGSAVRNSPAKSSRLKIFQNMRVPNQSVLRTAFGSLTNTPIIADEDQSWWEISDRGQLPRLPIRVEATRRGEFVYGLITLP